MKNFLKALKTFLLIFFGILLIIYIFQAISERQKRKALEKEPYDLKFLRYRRDKLLELLEIKRKTKRKRDWIFKIFYPFARLVLVFLLALYMYCAKYYYVEGPTLDNYLAWLAAGILLISVGLFLIIGIPFNILPTLKKVRPTLETWVYGKYLGIQDAIDMNEDELKKLEKEIINHPKNSLAKI